MTDNRTAKRCSSIAVTIIATLVTVAIYAAGPIIPIKSDSGAPVPGGTIKLSGDNGFFLVTDTDLDSRVLLVDLDGNTIPDGTYTVQIEDASGSIVREGYSLEIRDGSVFEIAAQTDKGVSKAAIIGGGVLAGALVLGGGGGGESPPPEPEPEPGPEPIDSVSLAGVLLCAVVDDPAGLVTVIGLVGGDSEIELDTAAVTMTIPIGGGITVLTGSRNNANVSATGFGTVAEVDGVSSAFTGTVDVTTGTVDGRLDVNTNGLIMGEPETPNPAVLYNCSGILSLVL
ncbi:MAG: hypothetical protein OEQ39_02460 [Gammaproteobacteria bacterium]|nr:hypothetical protein [Gammaproteobacteria bacterium]MDH3466329.1 hypothetical protein [Gammaproteobacteria bacterium]